MNKLILSLFIFSILVLPNSVFAKTIILKKEKFFEVELRQVDVVDETKDAFYFSPIKIQDESRIASWKVRFYCDKNMSMSFMNSNINSCGKAVSFVNTANKELYVVFDNQDHQNKKFKFALKAYDKNGKWIHTERKSFSWK